MPLALAKTSCQAPAEPPRVADDRVVRIPALGDQGADVVVVEGCRQRLDVSREMGPPVDVVVEEHQALPPQQSGDDEAQVALHAQVADLARAGRG